jgi:hypothetical protein
MTFEQAQKLIQSAIWSLSFWDVRNPKSVVIHRDGEGNPEAIGIEGSGYLVEKTDKGFEVQVFVSSFSYEDGEQGDYAFAGIFLDLGKAIDFLLILPARVELQSFFEAEGEADYFSKVTEEIGG